MCVTIQCTLTDTCWLLFFFHLGKKLVYVVTRDVRPSVCPSSVEITLEGSSNRFSEPTDLKISLNMGN